MKHKFESGDIVFSKKNMGLKLVVRRYEDEVYHCKEYNSSKNKEHAYFERELVESTNPADKKRSWDEI